MRKTEEICVKCGIPTPLSRIYSRKEGPTCSWCYSGKGKNPFRKDAPVVKEVSKKAKEVIAKVGKVKKTSKKK